MLTRRQHKFPLVLHEVGVLTSVTNLSGPPRLARAATIGGVAGCVVLAHTAHEALRPVPAFRALFEHKQRGGRSVTAL